MRTYSRTLAVLALLATLPGGVIRAQDTANSDCGTVLILDAHRILEGDITRVGDRYRVCRPVGETWVPARPGMHLAADRLAAYEYLRGRTNLRDFDERMRLSRWCLMRGLRSQALAEAEAAVAIRPHSDEARRVMNALKGSLLSSPEHGIQTVSASEPVQEPSREPPLPAGFHAESYGLFVTKVQPILMNACASCHAGGKGGDFRLMRAYSTGVGTNNRATQYNLAACLEQIDRDDLAQSPLLLKAIQVHGGLGHPPLKDRRSSAYLSLERWVYQALADSPTPASKPAEKPTGNDRPPAAISPSMATAPSIVPATEEKSGPSDFGSGRPPEPPKRQPDDPFDPAEFNGMHAPR